MILEKKKIRRLVIIVAVFLAVDFWMYSSIRDSFRSIMAESRFKEIALFAKTAPADPALLPDWLKTADQVVPGSRAIYLPIDASGAYSTATGDAGLQALLADKSGSTDFKKGLESVQYYEPFISKEAYTVPAAGKSLETSGRVYFAPVPDASASAARGALVILSSGSATAVMDRLILILAIVAALVFTAIYVVLNFSRDPFMGFAIVGLFAIVIVFVAYPMLESVRLTFVVNGSLSMEVWKTVLSPRYLVALWGSVRLGILTATFSTIIGFLFAFLTERTSVGGKRFISTMATLPVISPPFSLTLSIILLFGNNGLVTRKLLGLEHFTIYGLNGLVIVQTIGMFPIAFLTLASVLKAIDSTVEDAALDLCASRLRTFMTITLPLALPGILSAWLLVFTNSLADFANPLLLSGPYRVLSTEAYLEVTGRNNLGGGAALSLLLLPTLTAFFAQRYWISRKSYVTVTGKPSTRLTELASAPVRGALTVFVALCIAFIIALYGTIVAGCFVKNWGIDFSFTLENIGEALAKGGKSILDTVTLAAIATPIAGILAMLAALVVVRKTFAGKRLLEALMITPFAVPGTLIGISYILAFNKAPLLLVGTAAIIVINYVIRELPVGLETGAASLRQIDPSIEEAAQDLGADMPTVFRTIVLPLIRPAFISSMSYTFVRSMTAVSAIIFLISARWYHLTVQIYNFSELLRFGLASVLATALIIIVLVAFGIMRLLVRDEGLTEKTVSQ